MADYSVYYMTSKSKYFNKVYINEQRLTHIRYQHDGLLNKIYTKVPQSPHLYHQNLFFTTDFKFDRIYFDESQVSQTLSFLHTCCDKSIYLGKREKKRNAVQDDRTLPHTHVRNKPGALLHRVLTTET